MSARGAGRSVRAVVSVGAVAVLGAHGCSYAFVQEAPPGHRKLRHFECTRTRIPPVLDTVGAGALAISAVSNTVSPDSSEDADSMLVTLGVALVGATAFAVSAGYGYVHTAECDQALQALTQRIAREAPPAATPGSAAPAGAARGCASDIECKGHRICVEHTCVDPIPAPAQTAPAPAPAPQTVPAPAPQTVPAPAPQTVPAPAPQTVPAPAPQTVPAPQTTLAPQTVPTPQTTLAPAPQ